MEKLEQELLEFMTEKNKNIPDSKPIYVKFKKIKQYNDIEFICFELKTVSQINPFWIIILPNSEHIQLSVFNQRIFNIQLLVDIDIFDAMFTYFIGLFEIDEKYILDSMKAKETAVIH